MFIRPCKAAIRPCPRETNGVSFLRQYCMKKHFIINIVTINIVLLRHDVLRAGKKWVR